MQNKVGKNKTNHALNQKHGGIVNLVILKAFTFNQGGRACGLHAQFIKYLVNKFLLNKNLFTKLKNKIIEII